MEKVRISKILSEKGLCSRREADKFIELGQVLLDGSIVKELGAKACRSQKIQLRNKAKEIQSSKATIILNKPVGYISHLDDDKKFIPAASLITPVNFFKQDNNDRNPIFKTVGLAPAGRLDIDSSGLLVLTQDGRVAKKIIGTNVLVEKEYLVRVEGNLTDEGLDYLNHGLSLDGYNLKPAKVFWQNKDQLSFTLIEGRNRQIRRMCDLVGIRVKALKRVRIGQVNLGSLPKGFWRFVDAGENF
jgi:23S rRNA pseudouridine2604 synthase